MKLRNILQIIVITSAVLLGSCQDALDTKPLDKFSGDLVWADAVTARSFVNDAYSINNRLI